MSGLKMVCKYGHQLTDENVSVRTLPDGRVVRRCLTCKREEGKQSSKRYRDRIRERLAAS